MEVMEVTVIFLITLSTLLLLSIFISVFKGITEILSVLRDILKKIGNLG